ncbi:siderophore ABC transporter substrate-binding protein [Hyphomicrobium sp. CS1GBMeth3]|uniref:siderophore ABC transporter substrate-binding protein n=1 Tax=Hyphomicrobium sp. CS1GBMeth3 TaxID=1892845 RepID=UPI0009307232|nr:siderophore ABC transporter substrate-binding protein [Hyphomicrobium sp. CS1GBMeth3]
MASRRAIAAALAFLLPSIAVAVPSRAEPLTVSHAQGETVFPARPKTVLTLDLASLETLDAIGVEVTGVVGSHIPAHLSKYQDSKYLKIGTLFEPDYETINAASPDLIIVAGRSSPKYKELSRIAPTIDLTTDDSAFFASAFRNARTLGRIFGKESEIEARIARTEAAVRTVREKSRAAGRGLILLATGGRLSAYGPRSRFGALHTDFGIAPAVDNLDRAIHGQGVSFELILKANPEWLFVIDRDTAIGQAGQPAARLLDNPLVARTNAWQKGHVAYLDPVRWYLVGGGLVSLEANADQIARALDLSH